MKKIVFMIVCFCTIISLGGCKVREEKTEQIKLNSTADKARIKSGDEDMYWLKVDHVERASKKPSNGYNDIVMVEYTYANVSKEDRNLLINEEDLKIFDEKGEEGTVVESMTEDEAKGVGIGERCTATAYYELKNKSDKVKINFKSDQYKDEVEFNLNVGKSQEEIDKQIEKEAVKGDFIKINGDEMYNKSVYLTGEVYNINLNEIMPTFTLKTKEGTGYGVYNIVVIDKDKLKGIKENDKVTVYGKVFEKNESGMPTITVNTIKK